MGTKTKKLISAANKQDYVSFKKIVEKIIAVKFDKALQEKVSGINLWEMEDEEEEMDEEEEGDDEDELDEEDDEYEDEEDMDEAVIVKKKKHKGPRRKMTAKAKQEKKIRDKKKKQLGIESGGKYKLKDNKKVKKTQDEIRRKVKTVG